MGSPGIQFGEAGRVVGTAPRTRRVSVINLIIYYIPQYHTASSTHRSPLCSTPPITCLITHNIVMDVKFAPDSQELRDLIQGPGDVEWRYVLLPFI
jgi:hypothetical protein